MSPVKPPLTQKGVKDYLRGMRVRMTVTKGVSPPEFRLTHFDHPRAPYFTNDLQDAVDSGRTIARARVLTYGTTRVSGSALPPSDPRAPHPDDADQLAAREALYEAVSELTEPEGDPRTYYAPVLDAMWQRLNVWGSSASSASPRMETAHRALMDAIRKAQRIAADLDRLNEKML